MYLYEKNTKKTSVRKTVDYGLKVACLRLMETLGVL